MDKLVLPEYGRHVQQMVNYCVSIPDREARTECAYDIAHILCNMFPDLKPTPEKPETVWDVINMMAGFKLDIDFPCEVTAKEKLEAKPDPIKRTTERIRFRHYGKILEEMIGKVAEMEDCEDKDIMIDIIANHMKKLMTIHNKEGVDDERIFKDLEAFSLGKIKLDAENYVLADYTSQEQPAQPAQKKKKKNNKKKG